MICLTRGLDRSEEASLLEAGASAAVSLDLEDRELAGALLSLLARRRGLVIPTVETHSTPIHPLPASGAMRQLLTLADRVAPGEASLLLLGETGTGKEWLARRLHRTSPRAAGPFIAVNCAGIPDGLIESELFGHVRGAFTGAVQARRGHFEMAHGGTLFLDEVGDMTPTAQVKLLRVLEDHEFQPVGSERTVRVDVRIIAATNRLLDEEAAEGGFRADLYYRLAVITLRLPPLRDRREDILPLIHTYAQSFAQQMGRPPPSVSDPAREAFERYSWPGNVRELINVVERAVLLMGGDTIGLLDLPTTLWMERATDRGASEDAPQNDLDGNAATYAEARRRALSTFDQRYLAALLRATGGRVGEAARRANMSPRTLYEKMKKAGLRKEDFKR